MPCDRKRPCGQDIWPTAIRSSSDHLLINSPVLELELEQTEMEWERDNVDKKRTINRVITRLEIVAVVITACVITATTKRRAVIATLIGAVVSIVIGTVISILVAAVVRIMIRPGITSSGAGDVIIVISSLSLRFCSQ